MIKIVKLSPRVTKKFLQTRLQDAKKYRMRFEEQWLTNEATVYNGHGILDENIGMMDGGQITVDDLADALTPQNNMSVGVNYTFKHYRFLHAQLSSNPPSVVCRPASSDFEDHRRADAADRCIRHGIRKYKMQEVVDSATGKCLLYGTGWVKTTHDENKGDLIRYDRNTGEVKLEGDFDISSPSTWDVWIDPFAKSMQDVKYVIERVWLSFEEAVALYPEFQDQFLDMSEMSEREREVDRKRAGLEENYIAIYHYWEKGLPFNGMAGRFVPFLEDGTPLCDMRDSPSAFHNPMTDEEREDKYETEKKGEEWDRGPTVATLPFHIITDIDVVDQVYGKSFIDYAAVIQDIINRLDNLTLDNIQAHGVIRFVLPKGSNLSSDGVTNTAREVYYYEGGQPPHSVSAPTQMPEVMNFRNSLRDGEDDMAGVNDAMYGKQEREQSGFMMQYATNQGNMIRRRLFNKYVMFVESTYKGYLNLIVKHWQIGRIIQVLGKEKAFEALEIKGADIDGGFDLVVEYGASFSLDPTSRREEIMQLMPIFEKYGVDGKTILSLFKLNELEGMLDINEMSMTRQREEFELMIEAKGDIYIPPREMQEHDARLQFCYQFLESAEYRDLEPKIQMLLIKHIKEREEVKAKGVPNPQAANVGNNPAGPAGGLGVAPPAGPEAAAPLGVAGMAEAMPVV